MCACCVCPWCVFQLRRPLEYVACCVHCDTGVCGHLRRSKAGMGDVVTITEQVLSSSLTNTSCVACGRPVSRSGVTQVCMNTLSFIMVTVCAVLTRPQPMLKDAVRGWIGNVVIRTGEQQQAPEFVMRGDSLKLPLRKEAVCVRSRVLCCG